MKPRAERDEVLSYAANLPRRGGDGGGRVVGFLLLAYLGLAVLGLLAMQVPGVSVAGQERGFRRTVFATANAVTLTGFQQDVGSDRTGADVLRLVLTLGATLFTLTVGGMAVVRIARLEYGDAQVAAAAGAVTLVATLGGAVFLYDGPDRSILDALLQAASAFGNSGLYGGRLPGALDWQTHGVLLPLAFAGALGVPVLMQLFDRATGRGPLSTHTRTVLVLAAGWYLVGFALLALLQSASQSQGRAGPADWRGTLALASAFSINARTAGFPFELAGAFARPAQWILIALMVVGGAPGGTTGGVKTTAVYHLVGGVRRNLQGHPIPRAFGVAACWVAAYFVIVAVGFVLLLGTEPGDTPDRLLFLAVSAASNVGLSHDPVSITGDGLFTLSGLMLAGRLAPLGVLWWMASRVEDDAAVAVG